MKRLRLLRIPRHPTTKGHQYLDPVRNQLVPATPEELVRQSVIVCLMEEYGYPLASLQSEEPVARGTDDRRRADIIVRLPADRDRGGLRISRPTARRELPYSEKISRVAAEITPQSGLTLVAVPDEVTVSVQGQELACRTLGFVRLGNGFALALSPSEAAITSLGLPSIVGVQVNGHGMTGSEQELAKQLGIPACDWSFESTLDFIDALVGIDEDPALRLHVEANALSSDGKTGGALLAAGDDDDFDVLAWFDIPALDATEEGAPDPAPAPPSARRAGASAGGDWKPIAVVECKAPGVPLTEEVLQQGREYARTLGAKFVVLTNGAESRTLGAADVRTLTDLPTYQSVIAETPDCRELAEPEPYRTLPAEAVGKRDILQLHRRFRDNIGYETPEDLWAIIIGLDDALRLVTPYEAFASSGLEFIEDLGVNFHAPGSPSGAAWPGEYRDLLVQDPAGNRLVVGFTVQSAWSEVNEEMLSRRLTVPGAWTYLLVAVSEGAEYESMFRLPLDTALSRRSGSWLLAHDGKMTAGKGSVARKRVMQAVADAAPDLLQHGNIVLAEFPDEIPLDVTTTKALLANLTRYALARRALKIEVKRERKKGRP